MERAVIAATALLALFDGSAAFAQTIGNAGSPTKVMAPTAPSSPAQNIPSSGSAPVGHRQPRVGDVPSEVSTDIDHIHADDVALDKKLIICSRC
jgi:hypothetical protein